MGWGYFATAITLAWTGTTQPYCLVEKCHCCHGKVTFGQVLKENTNTLNMQVAGFHWTQPSHPGRENNSLIHSPPGSLSAEKSQVHSLAQLTSPCKNRGLMV